MPDRKHRDPASVLALSAGERLLIACALSALIWGAVAWALW
jgi:hypothetical protein